MVLRLAAVFLLVAIALPTRGDEARCQDAQKHFEAIDWYFAPKAGTIGNATPGTQGNAARFTDESLRHLSAFEDAQHLMLEGASVTDTGLAEIANLTRLETIDLWGVEGV